MGRANERLAAAKRAVAAFQEVMRIERPSSIERDAAIQRFEFTFEAVWKSAKQILYDREGIDAGSPKGVIRACRELGWLSGEQAAGALGMADDRNLSVHTYNEQLALEIYGRLLMHLEILQAWLQRLISAERAD